MKVKDQLDREIELSKPFKRIVSLVPSLTELIVDLGLENELEGITKFCIHPKDLKSKKTIVGGTKKVHLDKIKDLDPDLILCNKEENTLEMVKELESITQVHVSNVITFEDSIDLIKDYGVLFNKTETATNLVSELINQKNLFREKLNSKKLRVAYFIWRKPWMVVGGKTFINSMLEINGWENIYKNADSRYPEISLENLKEQKPDLILLSSEPFPFRQNHLDEIREFSNPRIEIVDGEFFSWYGSRQLKAFQYFHELQNYLSTPL